MNYIYDEPRDGLRAAQEAELARLRPSQPREFASAREVCSADEEGHHFVYHHGAGMISIGQCQICREFDWSDIDRQIKDLMKGEEVAAQERQEP